VIVEAAVVKQRRKMWLAENARRTATTLASTATGLATGPRIALSINEGVVARRTSRCRVGARAEIR